MTINRHNYEELFLLYVDDELSASEREAVESFVQQNSDLEEELNMLKQATLIDENNIEFGNKESLYKKETGISLANYQEYFLLSVDNELSEQEAADAEQFVLKHPELQQELTVLKQAVLMPEEIVFTGKEKLYRTEKVRRIVPLAWMRIGAAAAISGLIATVWFVNSNNKNVGVHTDVVAAKPSGKTQPVIYPTPLLKESVGVKATASPGKKEIKAVAVVGRKKISKPAVEIAPEVKKTIEAVEKKQVEEVAPANNVAATEQVQQSKESPVAVTNNRNTTETGNENTILPTLAKHTDVNQKPAAFNAVYREIDNDEEEKSFYIGSAEINKNKIKGLFKKAAGLFEKKTHRRDTERTTQIAGFEVKG